ARISVAGKLANTASENEQHRWTKDEIEYITEKEDNFNSHYHIDYRSCRASANHSQPASLQYSPSAQLRLNTEAELHADIPATTGTFQYRSNKAIYMTQIKRDDGIFGYRLTIGRQTVINPQSQPFKSNSRISASPIPHTYQPQPQASQKFPANPSEIQGTEDFYKTYDDPRQHHPLLPESRFQYPRTQEFSQTASNPEIKPEFRSHPNFNLSHQNPNQPSQNEVLENSKQPPNYQDRSQLQRQSSMINLSNVFKSYREQNEYNGKLDFLDQKLRVFFDMCTTFGVQQIQFASAFPAMLTGPAHEYYYDYLAGQGLNFVEVCNRMKQYFETEERRYEMMNEWHKLSLITVIKNHLENSILNSFGIIVSEMQRIRRGFDAEHQTDKEMKTRLQVACRDVEACSSATMKLATSFEGLCSYILLAISTKSRIRENTVNVLLSDRGQKLIDEDNYNMIKRPLHGDDGPSNDLFYTDRQYYNLNRRSQQTYSRDSYNEQNQRYGHAPMRNKKCFVCQ
ncbi:integrase and RNaseH domain-containing protein, partial [Golovinomyces cichoracearum]